MIISADWADVDGDAPPNFPAFKTACQQAGSTAAIAIMRGAWGVDPDPTIKRDWQHAQFWGFTTGAYLYLRKGYKPADQIRVFREAVGPLAATDLPPIIDLEDTWPSPAAELVALTQAWDEMSSVYGTEPMIYDSGRIWRDDLPGLMPPDRILESPQWVAKPWPWAVRTPAQLAPGPFASGKYDPDVPTPWGPGNWWLHQYQGDAIPVAGFTSTVDLSRFNLMREGEQGARVEWVQRRLGMPTTGLFDASMASRLRSFQSTHGLTTDAIIGPKTFPLVCWTHSASPPSR